jgi:hypothetical protein
MTHGYLVTSRTITTDGRETESKHFFSTRRIAEVSIEITCSKLRKVNDGCYDHNDGTREYFRIDQIDYYDESTHL